MDERSAWESELTQRYEINLDRDREFLDSLWEEQILPGLPAEREAAEGDGPSFLRQLVETAASLCEAYLRGLKQGSNGGAGGRPPGLTAENDIGRRLRFDSKTKIHVQALSEYLSKIAVVERQVMEFRRRYLGGPAKVLTPLEIPGILESWSAAPTDEKEDDVYIHWPEEARTTRFRGSFWSAIGALDRLGSYLARRYPWTKDQATHFVLCGGTPQVKTVSGKRSVSLGAGPAAHKFSRATITLEIEAWMPPELVKKAYVRVQREVDNGGSMIGEADRTRRGHGRKAEVFRFVVARTGVKVVSEAENLGKLELLHGWRELRELWDSHLSVGHAWRYGEAGHRNFRRDFARGQEAIICSKWGLPGYPGQPKTAAEAEAGVELFVERLREQVRGGESNQ